MALPKQPSWSLLGAELGIFPCFDDAALSLTARSGFTALEKRSIAPEPCHAFPACGNALGREQGHPGLVQSH